MNVLTAAGLIAGFATLGILIIIINSTPISHLLLYRVALPQFERRLHRLRERLLSHLLGRENESGICNILSSPETIQFLDGLSPPEALAKSHAKLHFQKRVLLIATTLIAEQSLVAQDFLLNSSAPLRCLKRSQASELISVGPSPDVDGRDARFWIITGFSLANIAVLQTGDGLMLIDGAESPETLLNAMESFNAVTNNNSDCPSILPIHAILISHHHTDHVGGLGGAAHYNIRAEPSRVNVSIIAHDDTMRSMTLYFLRHPQSKFRRAMKQFGTSNVIPHDPLETESGKNFTHPGVISAGIGKFLAALASKPGVNNVEYPTHLWSENELTLAFNGINVIMRKLPGETDDQVGFYIKRFRLLHASDNFYFAFPNIYPLRGGKLRSPLTWVDSLNFMVNSWGPISDVMTMGHTSPIFGQDLIVLLLSRYRDSIKFVHDQSIRLMNRENDPDEIAHDVANLFWRRFPSSLSIPYTRRQLNVSIPAILADPVMPFYGQIHWAAKAVIYEQRGWFNGADAEINSHRISAANRAKRFVDLIESTKSILGAIIAALDNGECQWALELSNLVGKASNLPADYRPNEDRKNFCSQQIIAADWSVFNEKEKSLTENETQELDNVIKKWKLKVCQGESEFGSRKMTEKLNSMTEKINTYDELDDDDDITISGQSVVGQCPTAAKFDLLYNFKDKQIAYECLRREALWCLARREMSSSGRNWYLSQALNHEQKTLEAATQSKIATTVRNEFLRTVPDIGPIIESFPERYEPGITSYSKMHTTFWLNLISPNSKPTIDKSNQRLIKLSKPRNSTYQIVSNNAVLNVNKIIRGPNTQLPSSTNFIDIFIEHETLRGVLVRRNPFELFRDVAAGKIWIGGNQPFLKKVVAWSQFLELLLAIEHD